MSFSGGPRAGAPGPSAPSQPRTSFTLGWDILNLQPARALKSYFTCLKLHQLTVPEGTWKDVYVRETQTLGPKSVTFCGCALRLGLQNHAQRPALDPRWGSRP